MAEQSILWIFLLVHRIVRTSTAFQKSCDYRLLRFARNDMQWPVYVIARSAATKQSLPRIVAELAKCGTRVSSTVKGRVRRGHRGATAHPHAGGSQARTSRPEGSALSSRAKYTRTRWAVLGPRRAAVVARRKEGLSYRPAMAPMGRSFVRRPERTRWAWSCT